MSAKTEPGRVAYEARWIDGGPLTFDPWERLTPEAQASWARVEAAVTTPLAAQNDYLRKMNHVENQRWLTSELERAERERDAARVENARLRIALHDAIRRPLGVTPDSGLEFYDQRMADEAEERRRLRQAGGRHRYEPHQRHPQFCARCGYPASEMLVHLPSEPADGLKERGGGGAA